MYSVTISKNYLTKTELKALKTISTGCFNYLDRISIENNIISKDLPELTNEYLIFNRYNVLVGKGSISKKEADNKAILEFKEFKRLK